MPSARSIPACAGEPYTIVPGQNFCTVYPRVRGGTRNFFAERGNRYGLSPRARGNHRRLRQQDSPARSIPACAGEPVGGLLTRAQLKVYPRVRGGTPYEAWTPRIHA